MANLWRAVGLHRARIWRHVPLAAAVALAMAMTDAVPVRAASPGGAFLVPTQTVAAPAGARDLCGRYRWACARGSAGTVPDSRILALAAEVNRSVNRKVREISDERQYSRADHWALPTRRGGDCEDFALAKKRALIARGVPADRLLIATALTAKREQHAVLILRTGQGDVVLDNLRPGILPWHRTGYAFLRMQDPVRPAAWRMVLAGGMFAGS